VGLQADEGQKRGVVDGLLISLGLFPAGMALEEIIDGSLSGADVHYLQLRLGQGIQPEAVQDVIVEGLVRFPGIDQDPVAVVDDDLRQTVSPIQRLIAIPFF
jgi:hypothetical protein